MVDRHVDVRVDAGGAQQGGGAADFTGQGNRSLIEGDGPDVDECFAGEGSEVAELLACSLSVGLEEPRGELAFEGHGRQALTEDVVKVASHARPFSADGQLRQLGSCIEELVDDPDEPRRSVHGRASHQGDGEDSLTLRAR
jgi:hypothetical protein